MKSEALPRITTRESPIHGLGVFADEAIPAGTVIVEYEGERITRAEAEEREARNRDGITYLFEYDADTLIDGAVGGNEARYINHCCVPNCAVRREGGHALIYAAKAIEPGDELSIDYAFDKDDDKVPCCCTTPGCRGFVNEV